MSAMTDCGSPQRQSQVAEALAFLDHSISELEQECEAMEMRLSDVLSAPQAVPGMDKNIKEAQARVQLAEIITSMAHRLVRARQSLKSAKDRVEL
jgi:hypothetical protein